MARKVCTDICSRTLSVLKCEEFSKSEAREKLRRDILYIKLSIMALGGVFFLICGTCFNWSTCIKRSPSHGGE